MTVTEITTEAQLDQLIAANKLVVIDFYADWCGPCKAFAPTFHTLADATPGVAFVKVNVDNLEEVAARFEISAMPTFVFLKDGKEHKKQIGAKESDFKENLAKLAL